MAKNKKAQDSIAPKAQVGKMVSESTALPRGIDPRMKAEIEKEKKRIEFERAKAKQASLSSGKPANIEETKRRNKAYAKKQGLGYDEASGRVYDPISPQVSKTLEAAYENIVEPMMMLEGAGALSAPLKMAAKQALKESVESGLLSQTYKINPFQFKPSTEFYYRGIGRSGLDDALESTFLRTANKTGNYGEDLYMTSDFNVAKQAYSVDRPTLRFNPEKVTSENPWGTENVLPKDTKSYIAAVPKKMVPNAEMVGIDIIKNKGALPIDDIKFYKQDWLRGYKPIDVPTPPFSRNAPFLEKSSYVNDSYIISGKGKLMNYENAKKAFEDLKTKYPVLQKSAKTPIYFHGTSSASLPSIVKEQGIIPYSELSAKGGVPLVGELSWGIANEGINQGAISTTFANALEEANAYALGMSGRGKVNPAKKLEDWFMKGKREQFVKDFGESPFLPKAEIYDDLYNKRLTAYSNLSPKERAIVDENYPVLFGIHPTKGDANRFIIPHSDIHGEVAIEGGASFDEIPSVFVPKSKLRVTKKLMGDKTQVLPMEELLSKKQLLQLKKELKYQQGGSVESYMGGLTDKGFNYNGAWGGPSMENGGLMKAQVGFKTMPVLPMRMAPMVQNVLNKFFGDSKETKETKEEALVLPETINIKDPRKVRRTTGKPINPNTDLVGGEYSTGLISEALRQAKEYGLSKEDAWNLASIGLQESGWGKTDDNLGHTLGNIDRGDAGDPFVNAYINKMREADRLKITDPELRLQVYNGLGLIKPETEQDYHGFKMKKIYGVPVPKEGLSMRKNPLYGKQIVDIRENVLKKNPEIVKYIESLYKKDDGNVSKKTWGGTMQMGGVLPGAIGNMYSRDGAPSNGKYAKKTKASAAEGMEILPDPNDPERKYKLSATILSAKEILNPLLRAKDPAKYDAWNKGRVQALREKGFPAMREYTEKNPINIYLTPQEVKTALSKQREGFYEDYLGAIRGLRDYEHEIGAPIRETLFGGKEGAGDLENLNYGWRFATLPTNVSRQATTASGKPIPEESFMYSYDPVKDEYKRSPYYKNGGKMMSYYQAGLDFQPKTISKKGSKIKKDNDGYWNPENWGQPVEIDSNKITMERVYEPLVGVSNTGDVQYMEPGKNYTFDGETVTEYPIAQDGRKLAFQEKEGWGYKGDERFYKMEKPTGETRYGWNPGRGYDLYRTVTPYKTQAQIKKFTPVPENPEDVDFIANYSGIEPESTVDYQGAKHWNIPRFLVEPHVSEERGESKALMSEGPQRRGQYKKNILADVYKYHLLQNQGDREKSWKEAKEFMRENVNPLLKGEVYSTLAKGKKAPYGSGLLTSAVGENFFKEEELRKVDVKTGQPLGVYEKKYLESPLSDKEVDRYAIDWLTKYKKMPKQEAKKYVKTEREKAKKEAQEYEKAITESFRNGGDINTADEMPLKKLDQLLNFTNYNDMKKAKKGKNIPRAQVGELVMNPNAFTQGIMATIDSRASRAITPLKSQTPTLDMVMAGAPKNTVADDNPVTRTTSNGKSAASLMPGSLGASPLAKDIEFAFQVKDALKQKKKAKQSLAVSEIVKQASGMRPQIEKRKYVRPEDNLLQPDQMGMMPYGTGYDVLGMAEDGMQIGGNLTEIQNMYNPGTLYDNLGYEPLDESSRMKQYKKGGGIPKAQAGIEQAAMELLSLGQGIRNQAVLGAINKKTEKWTDLANQNVQQGAMAQALQTQFSPFMKNGGSLDVSDEYGWVSHSWQPQVITKFGDYNVKDLLKSDPTMDTLRTGGNIRSNYMGDDEMVRSMAMGGNLQTHWGGEGEVMSYNPYMPGSGETVMLKGNSHEESDGQGNTGVGMSYSGNMVEAERGEPVVEMQEGGSVNDTSAVVFGNMKTPSYVLSELTHPKFKGGKKFKGIKFKNIAKEYAKQEVKDTKNVEKGIELANSVEGDSPYDRLKLSSAEAMIIGGDMGLKYAAADKKALAGGQNAILDTAEEMGLESDALARGKMKQAKKGAKIPKGQVGVLLPKDEFDFMSRGYETPSMFDAPTSFIPNQTANVQRDQVGSGVLRDYQNPPVDFSPAARFSGYLPYTPAYKGKLEGKVAPPSFAVDLEKNPFEYTPEGLPEIGPTTEDYLRYGVQPEAPSFRSKYYNTPDKKMENEQKTGNKIMSFLSKNEDLLSAVYNEALPYLRPSNQMQLQPEQLAGEMFALSTNVLQGVPAQTYQPLLETRAPQMSAQEQLNQNQADFNAMLRQVGNNPAALGILAAQKQAADRQAIAQTQAYNTQQAIASNNRNIAMLNDASLKNLAILDTQYQRQEGAKANTKAQAQAALSSIASKIGQNKLENLTSAVMQNMYNFRFGPKGRIINYNPLAQFQVPEITDISPEEAQIIKERREKMKQDQKRNGSVVKAMKNL